MNGKQAKEHILLPTLFASIQCIVLIIGYNFGRIGFKDVFDIDSFKALGISFFLVTFPFHLAYYFQENSAMKWYNSLAVFLIAMLLFLVCINLLCFHFNLNASILLPSIGYLLFILFLFHLIKAATGRSIIILLLPAFILGVWNVGHIWGTGVLSPLYIEGLSVNKGYPDVLFHTDLAQMIKTYTVSSLGIDGPEYYHYHFGSHILAESLSSLLHIPLLKVYNFILPLVYVPLYIYSMVLCIFSIVRIYSNKLKCTFLFWFVVIIGIDGCISGRVLNKTGAWSLLFGSESYVIALIFSFLFIGILVEYWNDYLQKKTISTLDCVFLLAIVPLLLGIIGFLKISTLFLLMGALGYLFLRLKLYSKWIFILASVLCISMFIWVYTNTAAENMITSNFTPFDFVYTYVDQFWRPFYIPVYYLGLIVYAWFRLREEGIHDFKSFKSLLKNRNLSLIDLEVLFVFALLGFFCIATLTIYGGSAVFFSDYHRKITVMLLGVLVLKYRLNVSNLFRPLSAKTSKLICMLCLLCFVYYTYRMMEHYYVNDKDIRLTIIKDSGLPVKGTIDELIHAPESIILKNERYNMVVSLMKIDDLPINMKRSTLLFIPQTDTLYWNTFPNDRISFLAPALTGLAMVDGSPPFSDTGKNINARFNCQNYLNARKNQQSERDRTISVLLEKVKEKGKTNLMIFKTSNGKCSAEVFQ